MHSDYEAVKGVSALLGQARQQEKKAAYSGSQHSL